MLTAILTKIRALIGDIGNTVDNEAWTYTSSKVFKIASPNASTPTSVLKNGTALTVTTQWTYNTTTQEITIAAGVSCTAGDIITANFTSYKYSDTEITEHLRGAIVYMSVMGYSSQYDFELDGTDISPTPSSKECDLVAMIASIIIKPDWMMYKTPTMEVRYVKNYDKDEKIQRIIDRARWALGDFTVMTIE